MVYNEFWNSFLFFVGEEYIIYYYNNIVYSIICGIMLIEINLRVPINYVYMEVWNAKILIENVAAKMNSTSIIILYYAIIFLKHACDEVNVVL